MKKSAVKAGLVVLVLVAVILWTLLTNYFRGDLTAVEAVAVPITKTIIPNPSKTTVSKTEIVSAVSVAVKSTVAVSAPVTKDYANSQFCRAQYQELLQVPNGKAFRAAMKKNSNYMDKKCFSTPYIKEDVSKACFDRISTNSRFGLDVTADTLCGAFLIYSKYMLTDYLHQDLSDLKNMPDDILRAKVSAQFVPRDDLNAQLMLTLADEVLRRSPDDLKALKIYLKAQYFSGGQDFSNTGKIYPYITKAYKIAPNDREIQEIVAYSVMVSDRGLFRLTELEWLKKDFYGYYFYAWFHWKHKTDFEKVKLHLKTGVQKSKNFKYLFENTLKHVSDPNTAFGQESVFHLSLEPLPAWESM